jgi:hypothetical protein
MKRLLQCGVFLLGLLPLAGNATCYTVYNKNERVIFQSANAPVDMTQVAITLELRSKFGADAVMIFNRNPNCSEIVALEEPAPVLTLPPKTAAPKPAVPASAASAASASAPASGGSRCDGRKHCSQMTSCDEAKFFLKTCRVTTMDGDKDGIPCEQEWCGHQ